ncbi:hypothetical protein BDZ85DRAFT_41489 [Elsinoe ampelina]|uniref:NACHT domain-containing protein n=1 Tax=Elsinoe ampelina TaxID=302913 RepID=A0A6A6G283_9PEZI|nr:hypothetical protein BDZ85DRAFT_41489 [Elsinoe ampelina]
MTTTTNDVFVEALAKFKLRLKPEERNFFAGTTIENLHTTIQAIQNRHRTTRKIKNLNRLRKFVEIFDAYSKTLDLFVNVNDLIAFVWGPVKLLLLLTHKVADAFDALLQVYQQIGHDLPIFAQYKALFQDESAMREVLLAMLEVVFDFHQRALRFFETSTWRQAFNAQSFRADFGDVLHDLRAHSELVQRQAGLVHFRQAKSARDEMQRDLLEVRRIQRLQRQTYMIQWLAAPNMRRIQEHGQMTRAYRPESGQWLMRNGHFAQWSDLTSNAKPGLWIHGMPGAGKTVLASVIIDHCKQLASSRTLYFYCRHGESHGDRFAGMARSMIEQLAGYDDSVFELLCTAAASSGASSPFSTHKGSQNVLQTCIDAGQPTHIVIDGLDECSVTDQTRIISFLKFQTTRLHSVSSDMRYVLLSQSDANIGLLLSTFPTIKITEMDNGQDIEAFCAAHASDLERKFQITTKEMNDIARGVATIAGGMFLYAKLVMDHLSHQTSQAGLLEESKLEHLPHGLYEVYERILKRILGTGESGHRHDALKLLGWLVCAQRPLRWHEIQAAASFDSARGEYDSHRRLMVDHKALCGSLVERLPDDSIELVHSTTKTHISTHVLCVRNEHLKMTRLCLDQFCIAAYDAGVHVDLRYTAALEGAFVLAEYALVHWPDHLAAAFGDVAMAVRPNKTGPEIADRDITEVVETLDTFLDLHCLATTTKLNIHKSIPRFVSRIPGLDNAKKLIQTLASRRLLMAIGGNCSIDVENLGLYQVLRTVRLHIEQAVEQQKDMERLTSL